VCGHRKLIAGEQEVALCNGLKDKAEKACNSVFLLLDKGHIHKAPTVKKLSK